MYFLAIPIADLINAKYEYIQLNALEQYNCDGILLHPVIGRKKSGDYNADIIMKSYELMVRQHYPQDKVLLSPFHYYSQYAGPREAVFSALCRKNFGCNYFIVGRDHTGLGDYYNPYDSHDIFENLDLGIIILSMDKAYLCNKCERVTDDCSHNNKFHSHLLIFWFFPYSANQKFA